MTRIYMWAKHAVTTDTRRATQIDMCRAPVRRPSRFRVLIELRSDFSCAVFFTNCSPSQRRRPRIKPQARAHNLF
jgi:hypothetical protein